MERERGHRERAAGPAGDGEPGGGGNLEAARQEMRQNLLSAGDDLVTKALSGDSAAYLEASRQRGGQ